MSDSIIISGSKVKLDFVVVETPGSKPVNLTGATVTLRYMKVDAAAVTTAACTVDAAPTTGKCRTTNEIDFSGASASGKYLGELYISFSASSKTMTQQFLFVVTEHLPGVIA
jgi:archaellin